MLTRVINVDNLVNNNLWFHGPEWLPDVRSWPKQKEFVVVNEVISSCRSSLEPTPLFDCSKYSSLNKIFNITNNVFRFLSKFSIIKRRKIKFPEASVYWIREMQFKFYGNIYDHLYNSESNVNVEIKHVSQHFMNRSLTLTTDDKSLIRNLGLMIDSNLGLIRSRGRFQNADICMDAKYPILMHPNCYISSLFILKCHKYVLHGGVQDTLSLLRQELWIPRGRQSVKKIVSKCVVCKRIEGRPCRYPGPPSLPLSRVVLDVPFSKVGVDYSGPIMLTGTKDNLPLKVYICLFTCTTTRAVYLDIAPDMTAYSFLLILRRFCANHSTPRLIISDNGSNFRSSAKFIEDMLSDPAIQEFSGNNRIVWKFIAPRAPWQGGFYERLIQTVKNCLRKVLLKKRINLDQLKTVLVEIQSRINNRPLSYIDDSRDILEPLTPSHLLYGRRINTFPHVITSDPSDPSYEDHNTLNERLNHLKKIIEHFKRVWKRDYLIALRERNYGSQKASNLTSLKINDVVLVQSDSCRGDWPLGRILDVHPDKDGIVRSADVLCKGTSSIRTLEKLIPLEVSDPLSGDLVPDTSSLPTDPAITLSNKSSSVDRPSIDSSVRSRPQRKAGIDAAKVRQQLIANDQL